MVCRENELDSIFDLKSPSDTDIFFHAIWSYRFLVLNRQSFSTDWTFRILELTELCSFKGVTVDTKMSLRIVGDILHILYMSVTRAYKFLWLIERKLSFSNSSFNEEVLSPYLILKALSCNVRIFLPCILLRNIHTRRQ